MTNTKKNSVRLTEFGAAEQVGGSKLGLGIGEESHLFEVGVSYDPEEDNSPLPFNSKGIESLTLTHGHADHMGRMPDLFLDGFRGPVYSTPCTADIVRHQLNGQFQFAFRSSDRRFRNAVDNNKISLEMIMELFVRDSETGELGIPYGKQVKISDHLAVSFYEAGHIPGSAQILCDIQLGGRKPIKFLTTGDLGRTDYKLSEHPITDTPFVKFPHKDFPKDIDYIVVEATYGGRMHTSIDESIEILETCVNKAFRDESKLIIPSFSIMRTQMLLNFLFQLEKGSKIPEIPIYMASPSAIEVNRIMLDYYTDMDDRAIEDFKDEGYNPFHFDNLIYVRKSKDNKKLWTKKGPMVVIASSGMCNMGRIVNHLYHAVEDPNNMILQTGYQSPSTLGGVISRKAKDPNTDITLNFPSGIPYQESGKRKLNAQVYRMHGLSGHADGREIAAHLKHIRDPAKYGPYKAIFIKHGRKKQCEELEDLIVKAGYPADRVHVMKKAQEYLLE